MSASRLGGEAVAHVLGDHDLAGPGEAHQTGGKIDAAAQHVVGADDDVAHLDAGAQHDLAVCWPRGIGAVPFLLDGERGRHARAHVVEVEQHAVAQALDEPAVVAGHDAPLHVLDEIEPMRDDADLILFDEAHRAHDVDKQDCSLGPRDVMFRPELGQIEFCHCGPPSCSNHASSSHAHTSKHLGSRR